MRSAITLAAIGFILAQSARAQDRVTQAELLHRLIDLERLTTPPPVGERTVMFSSPGGRATDARAWQVIADVEGPGAITRMWFGDTKGDIRVTLDGEVVVETTLVGLLSGELAPLAEPFVARGRVCRFPMGFAVSCRVECRDHAACQINVAGFPPRTVVERFSLALDEPAKQALAVVARTLRRGFSKDQLFGGRRTLPVAIQGDLGPGDVLTDSLAGDGTVRALYVALTDRGAPREPYALHRCVLRVFVGGEDHPSVEAPLIDFFGSGFGFAAFRSLVVGTSVALEDFPLPDRPFGEDRFMYCYFPMPYRNGLRFEIENLGQDRKKIGLMVLLRADTRPPAADALCFHARYRREDPCGGDDYVVLTTTGGGRLVGCVLNVDCPRAEWWGAGVDRIWIDGEPSPALAGTGTDNYFDAAGGLKTVIDAFSGATRARPYGKNSAFRWQLADCVSFQRSLRFALENRQRGGARDTYFGSVAYWYGQPGSRQEFEPLTGATLTPPGLRIPGAIEIEGNIVSADWGNVLRQKYAGGEELSGERAANITSEEPVKINIPSDRARTTRLKLRVHPARSFETIVVSRPDGQPIGTVTYARSAESIYPVGVIDLNPGGNHVLVQCSRRAVLDCWILEDQPARPADTPER